MKMVLIIGCVGALVGAVSLAGLITGGFVAYYGTGIQIGPVFIDWLYWSEPTMWHPGR